MCHCDQAKQWSKPAWIKRLIKFFQENEHQLCSELHDRHQVRAQLKKDETRVCLYSEQNPWQDSCASLAWIDKLSLCRSQLHEFCGENILLILLKGCMKGYESTHIQFYSLAKNHHLDRKTCWKVDNSAGLSGYLHSVCLDMLHVPVHLRNFWDKLIQPHICRLMWAWK